MTLAKLSITTDEYTRFLTHLHSGHLADTFIRSDLHLSEERDTIYRRRYSKDVHRTKCQALTIARLTHSRKQQDS